MTVRFTTDVSCDLCGNWVQGPASTLPERKKALAQAKQEGWRRMRGDHKWLIDICPECQKEKKNVR